MVFVSVVMTIFNKENILKNILYYLFDNTSENVNEFVFVLDGCVDGSKDILNAVISERSLGERCKIFEAANVFELRANNISLRNVTNKYAIIVQDDMQIMEKNWDKRLLQPILAFPDIWAVTARTSCSMNTDAYSFYNTNEGPVGHAYIPLDQTDYDRSVVYIGQIVNRGPLLVDMSIMKSKPINI